MGNKSEKMKAGVSNHFANSLEGVSMPEKNNMFSMTVQESYCLHICQQMHPFWEKCRSDGFIFACKKTLGEQVHIFRAGDSVCVYLEGYGYVGIGEALGEVHSINNFPDKKKMLLAEGFNETQIEELYILKIDWSVTKQKEQGIGWRRRTLRASLKHTPSAIKYIGKEFSNLLVSNVK